MRPLYQVLPSVGARARLAISFSRRRHSCRRGAIAAETATAAPRTHTLDHHRTKKFPPDGEGRRPLTPPPPPSLCRRRSLLWLSDYFLWYSREIAIPLTRLPHRKWSPPSAQVMMEIAPTLGQNHQRQADRPRPRRHLSV